MLWDIGLDNWRGRACDIARRNLTTEEWLRYLGDRPRPREESCPGARRSPSIPLDANRALGLAEQFAKLGEQVESRRLFAAAAQLVEASDDANLANSICWFGALRRAAPEVLGACQRAVQLQPDNVNYRDSRGLARALTGDRLGAVADFRAYIARPEDEGRPVERTAVRRSWIEALEAGRDPFDDMQLYRLRVERPF